MDKKQEKVALYMQIILFLVDLYERLKGKKKENNDETKKNE